MKRTAILLLLALPLAARAHSNTHSASQIRVEAGSVGIDLSVRDADLCLAFDSVDTDRDGALRQEELDQARGILSAHFLVRCEVLQGGRPCPGTFLDARLAPPLPGNPENVLNVLVRLSYRLKSRTGPISLAIHPFDEVDFMHQHVATVRLPGQEPRVLFFSRDSRHVLDPGASSSASISGAFSLGVEHLLTGWDHLLFLAALVAAARSPWRLAGLVTGFTAGHTATLILAGLGWVALPRGLTECAIALSIAWAGLANLRGEADRCSWWQVSLFGLVHGLGFAAALTILLPPDRLVASLFAVNLGIEAAQLAMVLATWPLLRWAARRPLFARWGRGGVSAAIALAGFGLFLVRLSDLAM